MKIAIVVAALIVFAVLAVVYGLLLADAFLEGDTPLWRAIVSTVLIVGAFITVGILIDRSNRRGGPR